MTDGIFHYRQSYSGHKQVSVPLPKELKTHVALVLGSEGRDDETKIGNSKWFLDAAQLTATFYLSSKEEVFHYPLDDDIEQLIDVPLEKLTKKQTAGYLQKVIDSANKLNDALNDMPLWLRLELRRHPELCPALREEHALFVYLDSIAQAAKELERKLEQLPAHRADEAGKRRVSIGLMIQAYRQKFGKRPLIADISPFTDAVLLVFLWLNKQDKKAGREAGLPDKERTIRDWISTHAE